MLELGLGLGLGLGSDGIVGEAVSDPVTGVVMVTITNIDSATYTGTVGQYL